MSKKGTHNKSQIQASGKIGTKDSQHANKTEGGRKKNRKLKKNMYSKEDSD